MKLSRILLYVASVILVCSHNANALRIEMIGASNMDAVNYAGFTEMAESRGYTHVWDRQMIPGAPISWCYEHPKGGNVQMPWGAPWYALRDYTWDVLVLEQTYQMSQDTLYTDSMLGRALVTSPALQLYMYGANGNKNDRPAGTDLDAAGFDSLYLKRPAPGSELSTGGCPKLYFDAIVPNLRKLNRHAKPVLAIPVFAAFVEFNHLAAAGLIPGYTSGWDLYQDDIHPNSVGSYLVGCTFFAAIYKDDPRGLPVPSQYGALLDTVARQIQHCAWAAVTADPLAGVDPSTLRIIAHDSLPTAHDHVAYTTGFCATQAPVTFSISAGALPPGLQLDAVTGLIAGRPIAAGSYTFTLSAENTTSHLAATPVTRTIVVSSTTTPVIVTTPFDSSIIGCTAGSATQIEDRDIPLVSRLGYDSVTWSVAAGALPPGLTIASGYGLVRGIPASGKIMGVPTQQGSFSFTLQARDGLGQTATRDVSLKVAGRPLHGLDYEYYSCDTLHSVSSYQNLQPAKVGITQNGISYLFADQPSGFAMRLHGWIVTTVAGTYSFRNGADYVALMVVDSRTITNEGVDYMGFHSVTDTITLQPGYHRFEYVWYNRDGGWLNPGWQKPGDASVGTIPLTSFFCDSASTTGAIDAQCVGPRTPACQVVRTYDLAGRLVRATGSSAVASIGRATATGVYIVRQSGAGGASSAQKHVAR